MHILHISPYYAPAYSFGGVVAMVEGLAQAQIAQGHQVTILTTDALSLTERYAGALDEMRGGVRVLRARNWVYGLRKLNLSTPFAIAAIAKSILPTVDVVHLHEFRTLENVLLTSIIQQMAKPMILSPHGTLTLETGRSALKNVWDRLLSPSIASRIAQIVALAQAEVADIDAVWRTFAEPVPIAIIPNGIYPQDFAHLPDPASFRQRYGLGDERVVLFLGRLHLRKGVDVLAQAFIQANIPHTKLVFAGPDEGMQAKLASYGDGRLIFTGFLNREQRLEALATASLFVLPAVGEGLSMAVLEAMGAGLPVLLSHGCNLPEAEEAGAGRVIDPQVDVLRDTLRDMLTSPEQLAQMGVKARQLILERFTWDIVAQQYQQIYQQVSR